MPNASSLTVVSPGVLHLHSRLQIIQEAARGKVAVLFGNERTGLTSVQTPQPGPAPPSSSLPCLKPHNTFCIAPGLTMRSAMFNHCPSRPAASAEDLALAHAAVFVPTAAAAGKPKTGAGGRFSLNLSHATAILAYDLFQAVKQPALAAAKAAEMESGRNQYLDTAVSGGLTTWDFTLLPSSLSRRVPTAMTRWRLPVVCAYWVRRGGRSWSRSSPLPSEHSPSSETRRRTCAPRPQEPLTSPPSSVPYASLTVSRCVTGEERRGAAARADGNSTCPWKQNNDACPCPQKLDDDLDTAILSRALSAGPILSKDSSTLFRLARRVAAVPRLREAAGAQPGGVLDALLIDAARRGLVRAQDGSREGRMHGLTMWSRSSCLSLDENCSPRLHEFVCYLVPSCPEINRALPLPCAAAGRRRRERRRLVGARLAVIARRRRRGGEQQRDRGVRRRRRHRCVQPEKGGGVPPQLGSGADRAEHDEAGDGEGAGQSDAGAGRRRRCLRRRRYFWQAGEHHHQGRGRRRRRGSMNVVVVV